MAQGPYYRTVRREWGSGSLYEVNGRWRVSISLGCDPFGKRRRKTWQYGTEERAEAKLREVSGRLDRGLPPEARRMTLAAYVPEWLESIEHTVKLPTYQQYRSLAEVHLDDLGPYQLRGIAAPDVRRLLNARLREGYATRTVIGILTVLRMILRMAVEDGYVERNVAEHVKPPRLVQREPQHFSAEQARTFLEVAKDDKLYSLYAVALGTGLRRGELLGLSWRDVDAGGLGVRVRSGKTAAAARHVPLCGFAAEALAGLDRRPGPIWPVSPWWVTRRFGQLCEKAGLPKIGLHGLRHTAASLLLEQGVDPLVIQQILGHSRVSMTGHYARSGAAQQREAMEKLGRAVNG